MRAVLWPAFLVVATLVWCAGHGRPVSAHGTSEVVWNREISRIVLDKCASCHRPQGQAFPLLTYLDAQPRINAIKDAVLARRMPPWGAVRGFGQFRNDQSLTLEQVELVTRWVDGGGRRGNNPAMLPPPRTFSDTATPALRPPLRITGATTLRGSLVLDGISIDTIAPGTSAQITATLPDGRVEPIIWIKDYDSRFPHPFLLRQSLRLPAGTVIRGVPAGTAVALHPR